MRRAPHLKVTVLERSPSLGRGSSGYSTGFLRAFYSLDETMRLALDGIAAFKHWQAYLESKSATETFTETGALWMMGRTPEEDEAMRSRLARHGITAHVLDAHAVNDRWPLMSTLPCPSADLDGDGAQTHVGPFSALYEEGCGHVDPSTCLRDLADAVRGRGVDLRLGEGAARLMTADAGNVCTGVVTTTGDVVTASTAVVNAAGPWFNALMPASVATSTTALATRVQVAHKAVDGDFLNLPFVADCWGGSGVYFVPRRASRQLVFGSLHERYERETLADPDECNMALDPDMRHAFVSCLLHRLPTLPASGPVTGFSHMYTMNQDDVHPIIGETNVRRLWACNGFSGHGFKLAPAVGSLVAQQITGLRTAAWDTSAAALDFWGPGRAPLTSVTSKTLVA